MHNALLPRIARTTGELTVGNAAIRIAEALAVLLGPLACAALIGAPARAESCVAMGLACWPRRAHRRPAGRRQRGGTASGGWTRTRRPGSGRSWGTRPRGP